MESHNNPNQPDLESAAAVELAEIRSQLEAVHPVPLEEADWSEFSEKEKTIHLVCWLDAKLSSGGFSAYFSFPGGGYLEETKQALLRIQAPKCASILVEAAAVFFGPMDPHSSYEDRNRRLEELSDEEYDMLDSELSDRFFDIVDGEDGHGGDEGILHLLLQYWHQSDSGYPIAQK